MSGKKIIEGMKDALAYSVLTNRGGFTDLQAKRVLEVLHEAGFRLAHEHDPN